MFDRHRGRGKGFPCPFGACPGAVAPPGSIALGKRLFYRQIETTMEEAYGVAAETMACNMQDDDARNGIDAFIAKRPMPPWTGR